MTRTPRPRSTRRDRAPRAYVAALPLSALPELREILAPLMGDGARRGTVVMMRLGDEALARIDRLVEGGLFGSRSEAAAFLVGAGIEAQRDLFQRIDRHSDELQRIRRSLQQAALDSLRGRGPSAGRTSSGRAAKSAEASTKTRRRAGKRTEPE